MDFHGQLMSDPGQTGLCLGFVSDFQINGQQISPCNKLFFFGPGTQNNRNVLNNIMLEDHT